MTDDAPLSDHILIPTGTLQNLFGGCICGEWELGFPGIDDAAHAARRKSYEEHVERHTVTDPKPELNHHLFKLVGDALAAPRRDDAARLAAEKVAYEKWRENGETTIENTHVATDGTLSPAFPDRADLPMIVKNVTINAPTDQINAMPVDTVTTTDHYAEAEKHLADAEEVHGDILKAQHRELARIHADLALVQALGERGGL